MQKAPTPNGTRRPRPTGATSCSPPLGARLAGTRRLRKNGSPSAARRSTAMTSRSGELTWVSHARARIHGDERRQGCARYPIDRPGQWLAHGRLAGGAAADSEDWNRAISENGEYIIFTTAEKLQADDENEAPNVYEWHNGTVGNDLHRRRAFGPNAGGRCPPLRCRRPARTSSSSRARSSWGRTPMPWSTSTTRVWVAASRRRPANPPAPVKHARGAHRRCRRSARRRARFVHGRAETVASALATWACRRARRRPSAKRQAKPYDASRSSSPRR